MLLKAIEGKRPVRSRKLRHLGMAAFALGALVACSRLPPAAAASSKLAASPDATPQAASAPPTSEAQAVSTAQQAGAAESADGRCHDVQLGGVWDPGIGAIGGTLRPGPVVETCPQASVAVAAPAAARDIPP